MQKTNTPSRNLFWPLLILALGALLLALGLEAFPATVADLIRRAWPALLILVGLALLLDQIGPARRFAPLIALAVVGVILAGTVLAAYSTRSGTFREDNVVQFEQVLAPEVTSLHVIVRGLDNSVEISPIVPDEQSRLTAEFVGSTESVIAPEYEISAEGVATLTIEETRPNAVPALETVGRGQLHLELPLGVPIALDFTSGTGTVSLNLLGLQVRRLDVLMEGGDLLLGLPNTSFERRGEVFLSRGDLTVFVPDDLGLEVTTNGRTPQFTEGDYLVDPSSSAYISRRFDDFANTITLNLNVGGSIRLE
ncbi:MAG: hypothetical protein JXN59_11920 [Anaerolineae bacterium]|nr:hypothetical protein [Anaerolineae bacterium]